MRSEIVLNTFAVICCSPICGERSMIILRITVGGAAYDEPEEFFVEDSAAVRAAVAGGVLLSLGWRSRAGAGGLSAAGSQHLNGGGIFGGGGECHRGRC